MFRGYDKDEVDSAVVAPHDALRADGAEIAFLEERYRRVSETADEQSREAVEKIQAEADAKLEAADARNRENLERFQAKLAAANARAAQAEQNAAGSGRRRDRAAPARRSSASRQSSPPRPRAPRRPSRASRP